MPHMMPRMITAAPPGVQKMFIERLKNRLS